MSDTLRLNRRAFIRTAGMGALAGAATSGASLISPASASASTGSAQTSTVYDFDEVYDRVGTDCGKWDSIIARYGAENIEVAMGVADMDFRAAPSITQALAERCRHENWGYMRLPETFKPAIADWNERRYGLEVDPELIQLSDGVHPALIAALRALAPPKSKVLLTTSTYSGFYADLRASDTIAEESPFIVENGVHRFDWDDLESRMGHDTDVLILCNPQNPTGNCWSQEDLLKLGRMCLEHRVVVLADEIHCDFVTKGNTYTPFASLPDKDVVNNSVTFKALSKTFSLAAMKVAWYFSTNPEFMELVNAQNRAHTNTLGVVANQGAMDGGEEWLDQLLVYLDGNHEYVERYVNENIPGISYTKAQGTYLGWLDVSELQEMIGADAKAAQQSMGAERPVTPENVMVQWLVDNAKVYTNAGSSYGPGGEGHLRMNLGTSRKLIEVALGNIERAVKAL